MTRSPKQQKISWHSARAATTMTPSSTATSEGEFLGMSFPDLTCPAHHVIARQVNVWKGMCVCKYINT